MAVVFIRENPIYRGDDNSQTFLLFKVAIHILNGLLFDLYIVYFTKLGTLIICCSTTLLRLGLIKLQQTNRLLASGCSKPQNDFYSTFHRFRTAHLKTMTFFEPSNNYYGRIFTAFLAVNFPASVWMLVVNVVGVQGRKPDENKGEASSSSKLFSVNLLLLQGFIIFAVHIAMAQWPRLIHQPAKVLLNMMAVHHYHHHQRNKQQCFSSPGERYAGRYKHLHLLLQVDHMIDVLHRKNLYTLNYASFGSITTRTFAKFLLFYYFKLLMICFKMLRARHGS